MRYLAGPACVGHSVELPDGRIGFVHSIAGPGTVWVLAYPTEEGGPTEYVAANVDTIKPYTEDDEDADHQ